MRYDFKRDTWLPDLDLLKPTPQPPAPSWYRPGEPLRNLLRWREACIKQQAERIKAREKRRGLLRSLLGLGT